MRSTILHLLTLSFAALIWMTGTPSTVIAQTHLSECKRDIQKPETLLRACRETSANSSITTHLIPEVDSIGFGEKDCYLQFWSFAGRYYPGDQSTSIEVPDGQTLELTSWYFCHVGGGEPGEPRVWVYGLDMTTLLHITEPVVELVDPAVMVGNCLTENPCWTDSGEEINALRARATADSLRFVTWAGHDLWDRTIDPVTPSVQVALYTTESIYEDENEFPVFDPVICPWPENLYYRGRCVYVGHLAALGQHFEIRLRLAEEGVTDLLFDYICQGSACQSCLSKGCNSITLTLDSALAIAVDADPSLH